MSMRSENDVPKRPHLDQIRLSNRAKILQLLRREQGISRIDLAEKSGLTQTAISRLVKDLIEKGICTESDHYRGDVGRGRRRVGLQLDPNGGFVVSACLSAFSKMVAISDISGAKRFKAVIPEQHLENAGAAVDFIGTFVDKTCSDEGIDREQILGAAIVIAGSIAVETGHLRRAPLLGWADFPVRAAFEKRLGCRIIVENVANALCQTSLITREAGNADSRNTFLVHVAAGMGASFSIDGKIIRRHDDENWIGRMPVDLEAASKASGGTLEETSSGQAIIKKFTRDGLGCLGYYKCSECAEFSDCLQSLVSRALDGDKIAQNAFYAAGHVLGKTMFSLTAAYRPEAIALAGPTATVTFFERGVRDGYAQQTSGMNVKTSEIVTLDISYIDASQTIALNQFFFSEEIGATG